jgi:hypothetical protein
MRRLLDFLPASNEKGTMPIKKITDPGDRLVPEIDRLVPDDPNTPYDMKDVIRRVVDHGELFEIMPVRKIQMTSSMLLIEWCPHLGFAVSPSPFAVRTMPRTFAPRLPAWKAKLLVWLVRCRWLQLRIVWNPFLSLCICPNCFLQETIRLPWQDAWILVLL